MKICEFCKKEFDPYQPYAKCCSVSCNKRKYYQENKEKIKAKKKQFAQNNPDEVKQWRQRTYQKNKTKKAIQNLNWQKKNPEKYREMRRRIESNYIKKHPDRIIKHRIRAIAQKIRIDDKQCEICGSKKNLERHHPDYNNPKQIEILCRQHHRLPQTPY